MKPNKPKTAKSSGTERSGLIVATFGGTADVEDEEGALFRCHFRRNSEPAITGDQVIWAQEKNGTNVIIAHLPRKSLLGRPENAHRMKLIAANIDAIIIVTAPPPIFSNEMIDRYLIAAENLQITPIILLNKVDLLNPKEKIAMEEQLAVYEKIGYSVIFSSTLTANGLTQLAHVLQNKTCVLVGASGVGKSSIVAALTQDQSIVIGDVSASTHLGKHTTTATRLYHLQSGGNLIDSPGVREFGLWHVSKEEIRHGFCEFRVYAKNCKFRDCQHQKEPQCAVQKAISLQQISQERFDNYEKILSTLMDKKHD